MNALAGKLEFANDRDSDPNVEAARKFYCGLLGGREMSSPARHDAGGRLWFLVAGARIETGSKRRDAASAVVLRLKDPAVVAARCWNAGYTVLVESDDDMSSPAAFGVLDPFGLRINLVAL